MRRVFEIVVVTAAVAFAVHGLGVRKANAESRPSVTSPQTSPDVKSKTRHRVTRAPRHAGPTHAAAATEAAPAGAEVFLSDAWLKQEKQTDDRLKRFMNICKGC
jgi:hypothetical protein